MALSPSQGLFAHIGSVHSLLLALCILASSLGIKIPSALAQDSSDSIHEFIELDESANGSNDSTESLGNLVEELLQRAITQENEGNLQEAITSYETILQQDPENSLARLALARLYSLVGNYEASLTLLEQLISENPDNVDLKVQQAQATSWSGDLEQSIQQYQSIVEQHPANVSARLGLAEVLSWDKRYPESLAIYAAISEQEPDLIRARLGQAEVLLWAGESQESLEFYEELRSQFPDSVGVSLGLARAYEARGQRIDALAILAPLVAEDNADAIAIQRRLQSTYVTSEVVLDTTNSGESSQRIQARMWTPLPSSDFQQTIGVGFGNFQQTGITALQNYELDVGLEIRRGDFDFRGSAGIDVFSRVSTVLRLNSRVTYQATPNLNVSANFSYGAYKDNAASLENQISASRLIPSLYWQIDPATDLLMSYTLGLYSDGNTENQALLYLSREFGSFYLGGLLLYWGYANDFDNGYFAPPDYFLYYGELGFEERLTESVECRVSVGLGRQQYENVNEQTYGLKTGCGIAFMPNVQVDLGYSLSNNARLSSGSGNGSIQQVFQGSINYTF